MSAEKRNPQTSSSGQTEKKRHSCDICGKTFPNVGSLNRHGLIHKGIKDYTCNECGKTFSHKGNLNKHSSTHAAIKPLICDVCGKGFAHKEYLKKHLVIHGRKKKVYTGPVLTFRDDKFIECNECGMSLPNRDFFEDHVKGNGAFKCKKCGECFPNKCILYIHFKSHVPDQSCNKKTNIKSCIIQEEAKAVTKTCMLQEEEKAVTKTCIIQEEVKAVTKTCMLKEEESKADINQMWSEKDDQKSGIAGNRNDWSFNVNVNVKMEDVPDETMEENNLSINHGLDEFAFDVVKDHQHAIDEFQFVDVKQEHEIDFDINS